MNWDRESLLRQFSMISPGRYHGESRHRVTHLDPHALRNAAVLIGFVERNSQISIIMTRRANHLRHHPGQVSFPGGKAEASDPDLIFTAQRETGEEIGIPPDKINIFGQLPQLVTVSGFTIQPVLAFIDNDYQLNIDHNEVADVFELPLSHILNRNNLVSQRFILKKLPHHIFALPYRHYLIWGATAQILHLLKQHLTYNQ